MTRAFILGMHVSEINFRFWVELLGVPELRHFQAFVALAAGYRALIVFA